MPACKSRLVGRNIRKVQTRAVVQVKTGFPEPRFKHHSAEGDDWGVRGSWLSREGSANTTDAVPSLGAAATHFVFFSWWCKAGAGFGALRRRVPLPTPRHLSPAVGASIRARTATGPASIVATRLLRVAAASGGRPVLSLYWGALLIASTGGTGEGRAGPRAAATSDAIACGRVARWLRRCPSPSQGAAAVADATATVVTACRRAGLSSAATILVQFPFA